MITDLDELCPESCEPTPCNPDVGCSPCEVQQEYENHKRFSEIEKRVTILEQGGQITIGIEDVEGLAQALANKQPSGNYAPQVHAHANATPQVAGFMSGTDKAKLNGVQMGATLNQTDSHLLNRGNHTGTQPASSISDFSPTVRGTLLASLVTAASRALPVATDTFMTAWGKVVKYLGDLKPVAFSGSKADVGLGNVDNTTDLNKPISTATQTALDTKEPRQAGKSLSTNDLTNARVTALDNATTHLASTANPHNVTASQVGAYKAVNVNNYDPEALAEATGSTKKIVRVLADETDSYNTNYYYYEGTAGELTLQF